MVLLKEMVYDENNHCTRDGYNYLIRPIDYLEGEEHRGHIPAWSLHRLVEMMPRTIKANNELFFLLVSKEDVFYDNTEGTAYSSFINAMGYTTTLPCASNG